MTIAPTVQVSNNFVTAKLPPIIGAGGTLLYLATLNHWISLQGLGTIARLSGWFWRPELQQPLTWVLLSPFRLLPIHWIPLALNLFAAVCAGLVLALLARSVALLPHNVTPDRPFGPRPVDPILTTPTAWMPPVLAAIVCGLQLGFWEHATSGAAEMLDLLVFAYVIRCLSEFRMDQSQAWLFRAVFVYSLGITNNWVLVAYFPVFVATVLWLKGLNGFLELRFLLRLAFWGLAGLSLYLLLPAVAAWNAGNHVGFWAALKANLRFQLGALNLLRTLAFRVSGLISLLSLLILAVRWKSHTVQFGDDTRLGVFLIKVTGHFAHLLFLATALWLAFDPSLGPQRGDPGRPPLAFFYLSALAVGHCAGYFLLFGLAKGQWRPARLAVTATWVLLLALPLALGWRNLGQLSLTNGPALRGFARRLYADLPPGKSVVLSGDQAQLLLLQAEAANHRGEKELLVLDHHALSSVSYQRLMADRFKRRWPVEPPTNRVEVIRPGRQIALIAGFAVHEPLFFLHPGSGFLFERFTEYPIGLIHHLGPRAPNGAGPSPVQPGAATNELIWQTAWADDLQPLATYIKGRSDPSLSWARGPLQLLRLQPGPNPTAGFLGAAYSRALDYLGVALQQHGNWPEAGLWFGRALELNPGNVAARINELYNARCQQGDRARLDAASMQKELAEQFAEHGNWAEMLTVHGPVDEPSSLFRTGRVLLAGGNPRQAADAFARCADLAPDWPPPRLWLAQSLVQLREFASALALTDGLQAATLSDGTPLARLLFSRAAALHGLGRTNDGAIFVEGFLKDYGAHDEVLAAAAEFYSEIAQFGPELALLDELLNRAGNQPELLARKGLVELELGRYEAAITTLNTGLSLAPADENARLRRAAAYLGVGRLEGARADYTELLKSPGNFENALFGLGTVAWRERNTNAAIEYYEQYLARAAPEPRQNVLAAERLRELKREPSK